MGIKYRLSARHSSLRWRVQSHDPGTSSACVCRHQLWSNEICTVRGHKTAPWNRSHTIKLMTKFFYRFIFLLLTKNKSATKTPCLKGLTLSFEFHPSIPRTQFTIRSISWMRIWFKWWLYIMQVLVYLLLFAWDGTVALIGVRKVKICHTSLDDKITCNSKKIWFQFLTTAE